MAVVDRLDAVQRAHPGLGFPIAVFYKFTDDQGSYLAALITYYGFLSLFPLLLLMTTILGFALAGDPGLQQQVLGSALGQFPVIGKDLAGPGALHGSGLGLAVGILGSLYGGLGVANAAQNAMNTVWRVPRNTRPNPIKARVRSLLLLGTVGLGVLGTTVMSGLGSSANAFGSSMTGGVQVLLTIASVLVNAGIFLLAFRVSTSRPVTIGDVAPGALLAAVTWQVLQSVGTAYVGHAVKGASATNAVFGVVLGLIGWIYLEAVVVVLAAEVNSVRAERLYPRALLTPFTDQVDLTDADRRAYTGAAKAQQNKGFETVDVTFGPPPHRQPAEPGGPAEPTEASSPAARP